MERYSSEAAPFLYIIRYSSKVSALFRENSAIIREGSFLSVVRILRILVG